MLRLGLAITAAALLALPPPAVASDAWEWPVRGDVLTPFRNGDDPYAAGQHRGIDIAAAVGSPVVAAVAGEVTFAGTAGSSGATVNVRSADGAHDTSYLHLSSLSVRRGDRLGRGDRIGLVGVSGTRSAERPHLHFGVRLAGSEHAYVDPLRFLRPAPPPGTPEAPNAPAPVGAPVPVAPDAVPAAPSAPAPAGRSLPRPSTQRRRRPAPHSVFEPAAPARHLGSAPAAVPDGERGARTARERDRALRSAPSAIAPPPLAVERHARPPARAREDARQGGIDYGWLAACLGLLAVATALGHPDKAAAAGRGGRRVVSALLRPLASRG